MALPRKGAPKTTDELRIAFLRRDYVQGGIELDEFERRVDRILRGNPVPVDLLRFADWLHPLGHDGATVFE